MKRNIPQFISPTKHAEAALDEALAESFPASDPIAISFPPAAENRVLSKFDDPVLSQADEKIKSSEKHASENREIELKLQIPRSTPAQFFKLLPFKQYVVGKARTKTITSTYYDTPSFDLKEHKLSLRLRHSDGGWVQTFKSVNDTQAGLFQRDERSVALASANLDVDALRRMIGRKKRWAKWSADMNHLEPIFVTTVKRTIWNMQMEDGSKIEMAFHQGTIARDGHSILISEVELELKEGSPRCLFDCAVKLSEVLSVSLSNASKFARGYDLCVPPQPTQPAMAGKLRLNKHMTVERSFEAIVTDCMRQIQGNEASVIEGGDAEGVHQMRVGLRRLESCLTLFEKVITLPADLQGELAWLSSVLGPARDWEVLSSATLPSIERVFPGNTHLASTKQIAFSIAVEKCIQACIAVQSARYVRLMLNMRCWMEEKSWRDGANENQCRKFDRRVERFSEKHLRRDWRRLIGRVDKLDNALPKTIHKLRIAIKKARYTADFFSSLYSAKQVGRYINKLASIQDRLGEINDAAVVDRLLQEIAENRYDAQTGVDFVRSFLLNNVKMLRPKGVKRLKRLTLPVLK